ncbi:right-handed parallel beta-helix repeat-containing protein [Sphingomonas pituitosa]|uniref:right-handed parallel beta-helix repeat-containing protein n=1 Tax=Sphingomonas pituitosa TaxID=99597 RepID=UPI00082C4993|nr:right-handed parallel beta-helix repeat-containing protein [Sphingomonas pituitosa]
MISLILAATIAVATPTELPAALKRAQPGDVIQLAPGRYGVATITASDVTIRSADPKRPALFDRIAINDARNLVLSGVEVSYTPAPGEPNWQVMIRITGGSNITIDNTYVHGVIDGDVSRDVNGIWAYGVDGLTVSNSRFLEINAGIKVDTSRGVVIRGNDIGWIGNDAIEIPGSNGVTIAWNTVHDFRTNPGMHPDFVQCWTTRQTSGCKNVRIFRNEILGSPGHEPQGVFFGDEDGVGGYENIEITGNRFYMTMWHAISLSSRPKNVTIRFNEVVAGPNYTPWIKVDGAAMVEGNTAPSFYIGTKASVLPAGNAVDGLFRK